MINFLSSALSYYFLSISTTMNILYLSKIPTIFQAGFLCAQVGLSQSNKDDNARTAALGRLTMAYTVGAVIGPSLGGYLGATGDYYYGAKLAVAGSLLSTLLCIFINPPPPEESATSSDMKNDEKTTNTNTVVTGSFFIKVVDVIKLVWLILFSKVVSSVANSIASTVFPLILKDNFHMSEQNLGFVMSAMSGLSAVVNGIFLSPIVAFIGSIGQLSSICFLCMSIFSAIQAVFALPSFIALDSISNGLYSYLGLAFIVSVFQFVLGTILTSESTSRVPDNSKGTLLGLEHSLFATARIGAPMAGSLLLVQGGPSLTCIIPASIFFFVYVIWNLYYTPKKAIEISKHQEDEEVSLLSSGERKKSF